jgi:hypothetical protein
VSAELSLLLGSIIGGTGALLSYWAGWRARGDVMRIRGGVLGRPPLIFNEGPTQRGNGNGGPTTPKPEINSKPQPAGGRLIGPGGVPIGYQPRPSRPGANPPPSEP